jgi:hypothetical protein
MKLHQCPGCTRETGQPGLCLICLSSPSRKPQDGREADWEYNQAVKTGHAFATLLEMLDLHDLARKVDSILDEMR